MQMLQISVMETSIATNSWQHSIVLGDEWANKNQALKQ